MLVADVDRWREGDCGMSLIALLIVLGGCAFMVSLLKSKNVFVSSRVLATEDIEQMQALDLRNVSKGRLVTSSR
ncbi:MAG: hypothetical protein H0U69_00335 [Trueperaceae bacterium]|nr:hypothetical protein [Trueperaceae bacterium]